MKKVLFVCLGNICRSPMAEFVMKYLVEGTELEGNIRIDSKATSSEEDGNPPHMGTVRMLQSKGIPMGKHVSRKMSREDYDFYDYIIGMENSNIRNILRITGGDPLNKVSLLLDYTGVPGEIADPWYTGNFQQTYSDVRRGCEAFLEYLLNH